MTATFLGGSLDGKTRDEEVFGEWFVVPADRGMRKRETYRCTRLTADGVMHFFLAYTERCVIKGQHEGPCEWEREP